jgi:hypothetical protein
MVTAMTPMMAAVVTAVRLIVSFLLMCRNVGPRLIARGALSPTGQTT